MFFHSLGVEIHLEMLRQVLTAVPSGFVWKQDLELLYWQHISNLHSRKEKYKLEENVANRRCAYLGTTRMAVDFPGQVEKLYI